MASDVAAQPHIKAGKLVGIAVDVESAVLPDVPTFAKQGYPQVNLLASVAFLAPKGLPDATARILTDTIKKTVERTKAQGKLEIARLQRRSTHFRRRSQQIDER